jgi:hypothetical protein
MESPIAPAGWYPTEGGGKRYWDGENWLDVPEPEPGSTEHVAIAREINRPRKRFVIAGTIVVLLLAAAIATGLTLKSAAEAEDARETASQEATAAQKAARETQRKAAAEKAEEALELAADETERAYRAAAIPGIEASIAGMAQKHMDDGVITGPVLRVSCSPVAGGSMDDLSEATTVFECFMAQKDNDDGTSSGFYYSATMNWETGSYTYGLDR